MRRLRDSLLQIERVASVASILDAPLIDSPRVSLNELQDRVRTLEDPDTDPELARREFLTSPLYRNLLLSPDGKTTALQIVFRRDETYHSLLNRRNVLREKRLSGELAPEEARELARVSAEFKDYSSASMDRERVDIARVRSILDRHRNRAGIHLGGVPMIVADMIEFIRRDLVSFGVGVLAFLVSMLAIIFRKPRWVVLPMLCCAAAVIFMFGYLGLVQWRVTVVSSNFTSLLLIITLSLTVHLIVRYHELQAERPDADQHTLVLETVRSKALPSLYTALTTIVAFASLLVSDIRPVIDFGWIMAIGIGVAFALSFVLFPAGLVLLRPVRFTPRLDLAGALTRGCASWIDRHGTLTLGIFAALAVLSAIGISRLTVENRFIDHFKESTEIYQGMVLIDRQLGGTIPLDVIVDADPEFFAEPVDESPLFDDDPWEEESGGAGLSGTSYWYNAFRLEKVGAIHAYLDQLPESGKVLSMTTTMALMEQLNDDKPVDNFTLSVIHKKLPPQIEEALFDPYLAKDGNQVRFTLRVFETDPGLRRNALLKKVRRDLVEQFDLAEEQVHLSGMLVLYNNVLRSLYRSQVLTIGAVFLAIMAMFIVLFRSLRLAVIAIIPNLIAAGMVLGLMGWLNIPLDIMTITIAAITIGIAVDDTIHYVHRFTVEITEDQDYLAAVRRCHASVGRAMYYTSVTVIMGFSILALSNFVPTIYFGLFTGLAMAVAMIANLTLLALLLMRIRPPAVCWLRRPER
ncbi:MMPL family transporter [Desulfuromonas sp.]|uniref:efflux RND transporter permease subunit n=1 Tax=Desulfuromonas sp. TaxID=892 RepID=UPI0025BF3D78|nr:MMPL family transporter [Desulfuromonas sp.]